MKKSLLKPLSTTDKRSRGQIIIAETEATMIFLTALGYDTEKLSLQEGVNIRCDLLKVIQATNLKKI
jgi:hypothetical protein